MDEMKLFSTNKNNIGKTIIFKSNKYTLKQIKENKSIWNDSNNLKVVLK